MKHYDDILHLPHHRSTKRSHMSMQDRAAQFSPFAALTGFESAIEETGRLTDCRPELMEYGNTQLNQVLIRLMELLPQRPEVRITYFLPDNRKSGGHYEEINGQVRKIDLYKQVLTMTDGIEIPLNAILHMESTQISDLWEI